MEIVEAARHLFSERGYHAVTVEMIGERAGRSGPSVYQYFKNKGEIFRIFVDELGGELLAHARTLGDLTGADGQIVMYEFISGLSRIFAQHRVTAIEWPVAEEAEHRLRSPAENFLEAFSREVRPQLEPLVPAYAGGYRPFAFAVLSIVQWSEYTRRSRMPQLPQSALDRYLATILHRILSPHHLIEDAQPSHRQSAQPNNFLTPDADLPRPPGLRKPITTRSRATVERILTAATAVFAQNSYAGTTIQQIADRARVAKPSVYTYWVDQRALFSTLAYNASTAIEKLLADGLQGEIFENESGGQAWIDEWLDLIVEHGAVLHIWTHEVVEDAELGPTAEQMYALVAARLNSLIDSSPFGRGDPDPAVPNPGTILLWALLVEFPYTLAVQLPELDRTQVRDVIFMMLKRGYLSGG